MSSTKSKSMMLTLSVLIVGVALASYAFMPVSTFAADLGNTTSTTPAAEGDGGEQTDNNDAPHVTNETSSTTDQPQTTDQAADNQQAADNTENPIMSNETASNANPVSANDTDTTTNTNTSGNDTESSNIPTASDSKAAGGFSKDNENNDNNSAGNDSGPKSQDPGNNGSGNGDENKVGGNDSQKHEKKLYDDSKDYQGPKFYKYKNHDGNGEQGDSSDGHKGEYYNSHDKKFFKYKHDFSYYDNVKIIIHHFYFKDFVGADFFVHFDYEYHHDGNVQIFFDHPFMDHSYDDEGRFYSDDDGNEYQCNEYYQGSIYYEFENAFYKCTDLTASGDFEGGY